MPKKQLLWVYALSIVVLLGLAITFRSFLFPSVIAPIAQFFWAIYRVFASVNQRVYWLALTLFVFLIAWRILFTGRGEAQEHEVPAVERPVGREQFWLETISNSIHGDDESRGFLRRQLGQLLLSASNLSSLSTAEERESALPEDLLFLFQESDAGQKKGFYEITVQRFFQRLGWGKKGMTQAAYLEIESTLQSMEDYLEIHHEL